MATYFYNGQLLPTELFIPETLMNRSYDGMSTLQKSYSTKFSHGAAARDIKTIMENHSADSGV